MELEFNKQLSFHKTRFSTVLVLDDDEDSFRILKQAFKKFGPNVLHGKNLLHGLDLLSNHTVDLMCVDWKLDGVTGADFLRTIQEHKRDLLHGKPFPVFVTWSGLPEEKCHCPDALEPLHLEHWQKPLPIKTLEKNIETLGTIVF